MLPSLGTTRQPKDGEQQCIDYNFEESKRIPREALMPLESLSPPGSQGQRVTTRVTAPPNPLPSNWEIAYTETNEKYFIE